MHVEQPLCFECDTPLRGPVCEVCNPPDPAQIAADKARFEAKLKAALRALNSAAGEG